MLASVNSLNEVQLILDTTVGIIDLKNPEQGALGALSTKLVKQIVQNVNQKKPISATIGDLPMQAEIIYEAVSSMTETGVDYIKIGFFPNGDWQACLSKLLNISQQTQLIAVLFADTQPEFKHIAAFKEAGFSGIMLDTMDKTKGSLSQLMSQSNIKRFVTAAKQDHLLCGLAGSLKEDDIPQLLTLKADYLGFRGALCEKHIRTSSISKQSIHSVLSYF